MRHEEPKFLSSLLDGELTAAEKKRVESHLASCAPCRAELASLRDVKRTLSTAPRKSMPGSVSVGIEARLRAMTLPPSTWSGWIRQPHVWSPVCALALAALGMTAWMRALDRDPERFVPLEPLMAAHTRYAAESLVPEDNLVASNYSALSYAEIQDPELE